MYKRTGILNSWLRRNTGAGMSYNEMNILAEKVAPGSKDCLYCLSATELKECLAIRIPEPV